MPVPKSVMKIKVKQGQSTLEFTSSVDRVNYTLKELIRRANMDVGRFLISEIRRKVRAINRYTKKGQNIPKRYQYWARKKEGDLIIGVEKTSEGAVSAWWADQAEVGSDGQPKRAFIQETVRDNIDRIREIQSQYLSAINNEAEAVAIAEETEQMPETDDN
jgi:hypothetical protein